MTNTVHRSEAHKGLAALLAMLAWVGPFSIDAYLPSMPEIGRELGVGPLTVQQTLTAYMAPFAFMTLWHGAISDALGRRRVILAGVGLFALASLACALAGNIEWLLASRALQGLTAGAGMVVGRAIIRDLLEGADAQRMMSQVTMVFALAPAVAPVLGGWLHVWFGWRSVFAFIVLFASAALLMCVRGLPETLPREKRQTMHPVYLLRSYWRVMTSPSFVALSLAVTLNFAGLFVYIMSAPVFLMQHLHVSETGFLWLFGPATAGTALGAWFSGRMAGRHTRRESAGYGYQLMGAATAANLLICLLLPPGLPWSVASVVFYTTGMALTFPSLTLLTFDLFPTQRGLASSCQSFIQTTGAALVGAVVAPLVWGTPLRLATGSAVMLAAGLGAFAWYLRTTPAAADGRKLNAER